MAELKLPNVSPTFESVDIVEVALVVVFATLATVLAVLIAFDVLATLLSVFVVVAMSVATSAPFIIVGAFFSKDVSSFVSSGATKPGNALNANTPAVSPPIPPRSLSKIPSSLLELELFAFVLFDKFALLSSRMALEISVVFFSIRLNTPICSLWFSELM